MQCACTSSRAVCMVAAMCVPRDERIYACPGLFLDLFPPRQHNTSDSLGSTHCALHGSYYIGSNTKVLTNNTN